MTLKTIGTCTVCGDDAPNAGRDMCRRCYNYLYYRRVRRPGRNLPRPARRTSLTDRIEIEIALGTPTRDIMTRLDIDYGVVKAVRDAMDEAS